LRDHTRDGLILLVGAELATGIAVRRLAGASAYPRISGRPEVAGPAADIRSLAGALQDQGWSGQGPRSVPNGTVMFPSPALSPWFSRARCGALARCGGRDVEHDNPNSQRALLDDGGQRRFQLGRILGPGSVRRCLDTAPLPTSGTEPENKINASARRSRLAGIPGRELIPPGRPELSVPIALNFDRQVTSKHGRHNVTAVVARPPDFRSLRHASFLEPGLQSRTMPSRLSFSVLAVVGLPWSRFQNSCQGLPSVVRIASLRSRRCSSTKASKSAALSGGPDRRAAATMPAAGGFQLLMWASRCHTARLCSAWSRCAAKAGSAAISASSDPAASSDIVAR
jgi:hypothetical protein